MRRSVAALFLIAVAGVVVASAGGRTGAGLGTVSFRSNIDWQTFDYQVDSLPVSYTVDGPVYDTLIAYAPDGKGINDSPFVPYVASSWKATPKSVTFQLRRDVKCSDGHVLTPIDVLNSFLRWLNVTKRSGAVGFAGQLGGWGVGPYSVHANSKRYTFTFTTKTPYRLFLSTFANLGIICPAGLAAVKANPKALETAVYGSGPYTIADAVHGDHITYKLRPDWHWGPPGSSVKAMPQTFVLKIVGDETTAANLLTTGGLDIASVTGPDVDRLLAVKSLLHRTIPQYSPITLAFNQRPGKVMNDEKLRLAVMNAVEPQKFNIAAFAGRAHPATSIFRTGAPCFDAKTKSMFPKPNLAKARQILQSDGYSFVNGVATKDGQPLSVNLVVTTNLNSGPDYLLQVLTDLGLKVTLNNLPAAAYATAVVGGNYDLTVQRTNVPTVDPSPGAGQYFVTGPPRPTGFNTSTAGMNDPEYNRFFNAGTQSLGPGSCKYFARVQELAIEHAYVMPLGFLDFDEFSRPGINYSVFNPSAYYLKPGKG